MKLDDRLDASVARSGAACDQHSGSAACRGDLTPVPHALLVRGALKALRARPFEPAVDDSGRPVGTPLAIAIEWDAQELEQGVEAKWQ